MAVEKVCIINCFDTYEQRVDLLYHYFKKMGAETIVYTSDFRHFEKKQRMERKCDYKYLHAWPYKKNISAKRLISHVLLAKTIFKVIEKQNFDLLWVLIPPNSFVKEAARYKVNHRKTKLIFDIIDLWPETMPITIFKNSFPFAMWRNLRNRYLDIADKIVTECNLYQRELPIKIREKLHTIYLAREIKTVDFTTLDLPKDRVSLCYLGSINNIIDISSIVELIQTIILKKPVELHIIGDGEKRELLIESCKNAGAKVCFHGIIYDAEEKQKIFNSCHYGLNFMKKSVFVGLTMKSMDYFEAGLPIINNIHGDTWDIIDEFHLGINYNGEFELMEYSLELRKKTREYFEKNFSLECFYKNVQEILY